MNEPEYDFPLSELVSNGQWRWAIEPRFTAKLRFHTGRERRFFVDRALTASHSEDGYLFGYLDLTGAEVIPPQFHDAKTFEGGRAWVEQNARWGLIDASGSFLTRPMYDWIDGSIGAGTGGLRAVRLADRLGYVDETGALVITPRFGAGGYFNEGFSSASPWSSEEEVTPYGVIDSSGNWVVQPRFSDIWRFSRGLAPARLGEDSKWGFIDSSGSWIISPAFDWAAEFDAHGLARVQKDGLWGVIDTEGRFIIQPQFDAIDDFVDGIAGVSIGDGMNARMGFIDISGKFVIPPRFATVYGIDHGYAQVSEDDADDVWNSFSIDRTGERVANFRSCEKFSDGLAFARSHDGFVGVIDTTGNWIVDPVLPYLSQLGPFGCGAAVLESWGPDGPHWHHEWVGYISLV
ncbi:MAG: WG repeat-containing protein [Actinomycetes bacterium]